MENLNKYQNGKIYQIVDVGYTKCYVGSTCESLSKRMSKHRENYKRYLAGSKQKTMVFDIFDEFGVENCKIELIEEYPCQNRDELNKKEGFHIRANDCVNKVIIGRTWSEYKQQHKARLNAKHKEWYETHKHEQDQKKHEWYESHRDCILVKVVCECGHTISKNNLKAHILTNKHNRGLTNKNIPQVNES